MTLRTRFAPSPTGFLHIGGARTALFCHLHARAHGGTTVLRIEDTDRQRSTREAVEAILGGMHWMGLDPDEGPFFQSAHHERHLAEAHRLLAEGRAYRCTCSVEELDAMREEQREKGIKPRYDGRCRDRDPASLGDASSVIRFKTPRGGEVAWNDLIQGEIRFDNDELDDLILVRSDGSPTYNLAVVVDDYDMAITLVLRGEDHISNTPRQIHLLEALGYPRPEYAHMPLLHGADGAKLSKRHGAVSVLQYREEGFLPAAVNNYLVRLGWSHGDQEFFTMQELERLFDVTRLGRSASIFNQEKLLWLNGQHMRVADPADLAKELSWHIERQGLPHPGQDRLLAIIPHFQERSKTMVEMLEKCRFLLVDQLHAYDDAGIAHHYSPALRPAMEDLCKRLKDLEQSLWELPHVEAVFKDILAGHQLKMGKLAQPVRLALTGTTVSPGIYETLILLGRERTIVRLERFLSIVQ
ncbi:MAG: glutamate--tRNA ligase [Magnetococcales bacterium]|nr:glutamate--tRNA ligase [Magnetococcales bacterium]MBF0151498.1 glutamate--tRNA ligase [Magnetococcales bacterium]